MRYDRPGGWGSEERAPGGFEVRLQRLAGDGAGLIGAAVTVATPTNTAGTALAWTGDRWAASWLGGRSLLVRFLALEGLPVSAPVVVAPVASEVESAPTAGGVAVVWTLDRNQVWLRHVHADETQTAPMRLSYDSTELGPSIVSNGSGHGVAWRSGRLPGNSFDTRIYLARTSALGTEIDQESPISPISSRGCWCDGYPAQGLGWNGTEYGLVHEDPPDTLSFTRVGADGRPIGQTTLPSFSNVWTGAVAWTGSDWIVAFADQSLRIAAFSAGGAAIGTPLIVCDTGSAFARVVPVAGGQVMVVWSDGRGGTNDIYARTYALCR